jgi:methionyl-tRNA formyltransferase
MPAFRIVLMGSPAFGLPTLQRLIAAGQEVVLVVTQPDRPAGRARRLTPPPVAAFALDHQLPLYQPERLRAAALDPIRSAAPHLVVVAAYGLLLPNALLELPPYGCLNVHPSLLPRHRGASPVQAAILAGDDETGVTIIKLVERMDAGPILAQVRSPIRRDEHAQALEARLADTGAELLVDCLGPWTSGRLQAQPQDESRATYCTRLERADAELDWTRPADELARVVRAFRGRTDAFTFWDGKLLKVLTAEPLDEPASSVEPGRVDVALAPQGRLPRVATARGSLLLRELALEGRPLTTGTAFLNGHRAFAGALLGSPVTEQRPKPIG